MSYDFRTYHIFKIELNKRKGSQHIFDCESHLCCLRITVWMLSMRWKNFKTFKIIAIVLRFPLLLKYLFE